MQKKTFLRQLGNIKKMKISPWKELAFNYFSYFCSQLKSDITYEKDIILNPICGRLHDGFCPAEIHAPEC